MVTLCLKVVRTFFVLCCAKMCKKFRQNCSVVKCTELRTFPLHQEKYVVIRFHYLKKKNSDADVCSYERSVRWTDAHSQHHFPLALAVYARASLCITKAEEWETGGGLCRNNSTIGTMLVDDDSLSQTDSTLGYFANHYEKNYFLSFVNLKKLKLNYEKKFKWF